MNNNLKGLKFSIYADSISTFEGYSNTICKDNMVYFPHKGLVKEVNETWWMRLINDYQMELVVNNSSSGCYVKGVGNNSGSTYDEGIGYRIDYLKVENNYPDLILVYMGINDLYHGIESGYDDNYGFKVKDYDDINTFIDAYNSMINTLKIKYPNSNIVCLNFQKITNDFAKDLKIGYNKSIDLIAKHYGCYVVDLYNSSISGEQYINYSSDNIHPNPEGMKGISECVANKLLEIYKK